MNAADLHARVMKQARRVAGMISRAVVEAVDDAPGVQTVQLSLMDDELADGVEHFQHYGFAAHPHAGAEALGMAVGGTRSHMVAIAVGDRRYRLRELTQGEVALFDDLGQIVYLTREGIRIESQQKVTITAETVEVNATTATITADTVNLGGTGGLPVARVGDTVAGGIITSGSSKVKAA